MSLKRPASRIASMFSSGMRRSASACAALRASSGCSSVALRISSSASTAVSMTDTCSLLLDEVGDLALGADAEERLAVELLIDQRVHDGVAPAGVGIAPDPLHRAGVGEAGCPVGVQEEADRLANPLRRPA